MATRKHTKAPLLSETEDDSATSRCGAAANMDVETLDRFSLVKEAGEQMAALVEALREPIKRMRSVETRGEEIVLSVLTDRLAELAEIVQSLGRPEDDEEHTQDDLGASLCTNLEFAEAANG